MRFLATILAFFIFSFNLSAFTVTADDTAREPKVYITNTGEFYHSKDCHYLQSKIPIGLYQAKERGYSACSYCGGEPDGYYSWEDYENYLDSIVESHKPDKQSKNKKNDSGISTFWIIFFIVVGIGFIYTEFIYKPKNK